MQISTIKHLAYILKCKTSESELDSYCTRLIDREKKYDHKFYREIKKVSEKNGKLKTRVIHPPKGRLKLIQKKIKSEILDTLSFPKYVQGANKGYSNITNARMHQGKKYKFSTDIKKFYPSISSVKVYKAFCDYGFIPDISRILTLLTTFKGKLPQGAHTSAHIANMVFRGIDKHIYEFCIENKITYSRFIDDVALSSQVDFKKSIPSIISFITVAGFTISSSKTNYKNILDVTGITVANNTIKPNKAFFERLEDKNQSESSLKGRSLYLERVVNAKKNHPRIDSSKL
jgi:RNA-directed DNA polymerase